MTARPSALLVTVLLAVSLASCDAGSGPSGRWAAAAIDGVGVASATPLRVPVPPGTYDTLAQIGRAHV